METEPVVVPVEHTKLEKLKEFGSRHWKKILAIGAAVVVILLLVFFVMRKEHLGDIFYLDQIAMQNSDPTWFKYTGWDKDVLGMSARDYYLENDLYSNSRAAPQRLKDDSAFKDHTNYLQMPYQYRPKIDLESVDSAPPYEGSNSY